MTAESGSVAVGSTVAPESGGAAFAADEGLVRAIGLGSAILFVVGSVIGSGIFLTTGGMAALIPSASLLLLAWTLGGVLAHRRRSHLCRDGGDVSALGRRLRLSQGGVWAAAGVSLWLGGAARRHQRRHRGRRGRVRRISQLLHPGAVAVPSLSSAWRVLPISAGQLVAAAAIVVLGAINYVGVRSGNWSTPCSRRRRWPAWRRCRSWPDRPPGSSPSFTPVVPPDLARPVASFGVAMIAVLWTYEAWYFVTYAAGEIKDPQRNLPRALIIGILLADDHLPDRQRRVPLRADD